MLVESVSKGPWNECPSQRGIAVQVFVDWVSKCAWNPQVNRFVAWYNHEHRHSALKFVTPAQRHAGQAEELLRKRVELYEAARARHPQRWSGDIRDWSLAPTVCLNPEREENLPEKLKAA